MTAARPLRAVFEELAGGEDPETGPTGDPASLLAAGGHGDLPADLVSEAIVNYADTAPVEVAEHLAPFVQAHSPVPVAASAEPTDAPAGDPPAAEFDLAAGLELLATAPVGEPALVGPDPAATDLAAGVDFPDPADLDQAAEFGAGDDSGLADRSGGSDPFGLDFGEGDRTDPTGAAGQDGPEWEDPWPEGPVPAYDERGPATGEPAAHDPGEHDAREFTAGEFAAPPPTAAPPDDPTGTDLDGGAGAG